MLVESVSPHPLAEQAQACGRLTLVDGPEGPIAPVVTTGYYFCSKKKKTLTTFLDSCISSLRLSMLFFSVISPIKNCTCHPCAGALLILSVSSLYVALPSTVYSSLDKMVIDKRSSNRAHVRGGSR